MLPATTASALRRTPPRLLIAVAQGYPTRVVFRVAYGYAQLGHGPVFVVDPIRAYGLTTMRWVKTASPTETWTR